METTTAAPPLIVSSEGGVVRLTLNSRIRSSSDGSCVPTGNAPLEIRAARTSSTWT